MTVSFLQNFLPSTAAAGMPSGSSDYQPTGSAVCRKLPQNVLTDEQREAAIKLAGAAIERHMERYQRTHCFADLGMADRARLSMEALIKGRSAEQVAKMEAARGLT